jgi:hypothetical protein
MGDLNWGAVTARGGKKGKAAAAPLNFDISILVKAADRLGARRARRAARARRRRRVSRPPGRPSRRAAARIAPAAAPGDAPFAAQALKPVPPPAVFVFCRTAANAKDWQGRIVGLRELQAFLRANPSDEALLNALRRVHARARTCGRRRTSPACPPSRLAPACPARSRAPALLHPRAPPPDASSHVAPVHTHATQRDEVREGAG